MQPKKLLIIIVTLMFAVEANAQSENPYKDIGKQGKVLTLTKGEYDESFDKDSIQRIGSAMVNIHTMELVKVQLTKEELRQWNNSQASRFLSVDPLQSKYPMLTPYQFASNSPIANVDLDGREKLVAIIMTDNNGKTQIAPVTDRNEIINVWKVFSGANSISGKKIVWEEGVGAYGQTSGGGESRYKQYSNGYDNGNNANGERPYPDAIDGAGILTIDLRGNNAVMKYYDWELDYSEKVQKAESGRYNQIKFQKDLLINVTSLFIGVGELKAAMYATDINKLKKTFDVGLALSNVANSADDVVQGSKNLKEGTLKTILENLKGSLTAYNSIQGVKTLKDLNATSIDKTKALFGETQDAPEAFERIKKDIEILQKRLEDSKNKDSKKQN